MLFYLLEAWKRLKSKEILGFLGKPGVVFQEKPGEPGGNSWLWRKAWNLTTVGRARKAKKARNYQKCPVIHREAGVTDCCDAKKSQESQEWHLPKLKLPDLNSWKGWSFKLEFCQEKPRKPGVTFPHTKTTWLSWKLGWIDITLVLLRIAKKARNDIFLYKGYLAFTERQE